MSVSSPFYSLHGKAENSQSRGMRPVLMVHSVRTQKSKIPRRLHHQKSEFQRARAAAPKKSKLVPVLFSSLWRFCFVICLYMMRTYSHCCVALKDSRTVPPLPRVGKRCRLHRRNSHKSMFLLNFQ